MRSLSFLLVLSVVVFAWSCGEDGWCSNGAFLNEESCVFAGHEWTPKPEPAGCNAGNTVVEGQNPGDCQDGADNDMDGLFDCDDDTCAGSPDCDSGDDDTSGGDDDTSGGDDDTSGSGDDDTSGGPGDDDTSGGPGDDDSHGGGGSESGQDCQPTSCPNCEDGLDNDGDGDIDCEDTDCSEWCGGGGGGNGGGGDGGGGGTESGNDCSPTACPNCEDGVDNDGDGDIDCEDTDCSDWCGA